MIDAQITPEQLLEAARKRFGPDCSYELTLNGERDCDLWSLNVWRAGVIYEDESDTLAALLEQIEDHDA